MADIWVAQESFASGEISPSVYGLVSSTQYRTGCMELENALLTPTGAARKRYGTSVITSTTGGYPARLFFYFAKGRQFVVQFVSEDDDSGDLNTAARQVRVLDAVTREFVNVGDNLAHGPFDAFGDTTGFYHHFTASQLREVYSFQDSERIYFLHPDRPPLYLERQVGEGAVERWEYGLAPPAETTPRIVDHQVSANLIELSPTQFEFDQPLFDKRDEGSYWRIGGADGLDPDANPYGSWRRMDTFKSATRMDGAQLGGTAGDDPTDWAGPYLPTGSSFTVTINPGSTAFLDVVAVSFTAPPTIFENWVGLPVTIGGVLFLVIAVGGAGAFTAVRLQGGAPLSITPATHTCQLYAIGASSGANASDYIRSRPYLRKHPIAPSDVTGNITLYGSQAILGDNLSVGDVPFFPDDHEQTFDDYQGTAVGGTVHLNSGIVALTGVTTNAGPGGSEITYQGTVVKTLAHKGPSQQWGLGQSEAVGFPSSGTTHQGRVWFGGYKEKPTKLVGSKVFDRDNFSVGQLDDDAIAVEISDPLGGRVTWLESAADLLVGTATSEYSIGGRPITATEIAIERQSGIGSRNIRPVLIDNSSVFVDGAGKGIREMTFVDAAQRYQAPDLTDLAKHIFEDIVVEEVAYVNAPSQVVYVKDSTDNMYALSIWRLNQVAGWSRFTQPVFPTSSGAAEETSTIESLCAVRADGVNITEDELWIVRRFTTGGESGAGTVIRKIERMSSQFAMDMTWEDTSPTATTVGVNPHLIDLSGSYAPQIMVQENSGDSYVYVGDYAVSGAGSVTIPSVGFTPNAARMGRSVRFELIPVIPHFADRGTGDSQGRIEKATAIMVLLRESIGGTVSGGTIMPPGVTVPAATPANAITPLTEWRRVSSVGSHGRMHQIPIVHTDPYHFEVAGLNFKLTHGK